MSITCIDYVEKLGSVVSNIEPFDTCSFTLGKVFVHARSKFESVIFCVLMLAQGSNLDELFAILGKFGGFSHSDKGF